MSRVLVTSSGINLVMCVIVIIIVSVVLYQFNKYLGTLPDGASDNLKNIRNMMWGILIVGILGACVSAYSTFASSKVKRCISGEDQ